MRTDKPGKAAAGRSYIVRLYRHPQGDGEAAGIVESVEDGTRHAFVSRDELWAILLRAGDTKPDRMFDK